MGRRRSNLVYDYFSYDKETNLSKCETCERQIMGHHGSNLLKHLSSHHPEVYEDVAKRNMENKGRIVLNDSDGTKTLAKVIENCIDTRSPKHLKQEREDPENEEYDDPLQSSDDESEPPLKRERRSIQIERASSSNSPDKQIKTYKLATPADKFDLFGKNVALKLREISVADDKQRLIAEKIINDALFYAEMGQLTLAHCNKMNLEQ